MRSFDNKLIDELYNQAKGSDRKRAHYLLHHSHQDKVQRLLIALVRGSYVEPHFHELSSQWEMFSVTKGCIKVCLFSESGSVLKEFLVGPDESIAFVEFAPGEIHSVECLSELALMLEIKEGPFDNNFAKSFPAW